MVLSRFSALAPILCILVVSTGCATHKQLAKRGKPGFKQRGIASWYGPGFHGKLTANGETYDMHALTAAHKELPFDSVVEVLNRDSGKKVRVRINDRGPFVRGRIIDLSRAAAERIGMIGSGTANVELKVVKAGSGRPYGASQPGDSGPVRWIVQAGAFRDRDRARQHLEAVRSIDASARLETSNELSRIVVGPFAKEQDARSLLAELKRRRIEAVVLRRR